MERGTPAVVVLLILGLVLFLSGISHEALWFDESFTAAMVSHPLPSIGTLVGKYDIHPPLYYLALKLFALLFGASAAALRSFSALGALSLAALGLGPIRRAWGLTAGALYAFLVLSAPAVLAMAQEARMYTWAAFFVTACAVYGHLALESRRTADWIKCGAASLAAAYTHYYALAAVLIIQVILLARQLREGQRPSRAQLLILAGAGLLYTPWAYFFLRHVYRGIRTFWVSTINPAVAFQSVLYPYSYKFSRPPIPLTSLLAFILAMGLVLLGVLRAVFSKSRRGALAVLAFSAYLLTLAGSVSVSYVIRPILNPRYMFTVLGLFFLPAAYALAGIRRRIWVGLICALLLSLLMPHILKVREERFNGPMSEAASYLRANSEPGDVVFHLNVQSAGPLALAVPGRLHFHYSPWLPSNREEAVFGPSLIVGPDLNAFLESRGRIWLVVGRFAGDALVSDRWIASGVLRKVGETAVFKLPYSWCDLEISPVIRAGPLSVPR